MKFEFNIQIINNSSTNFKGELTFRPEDFDAVEMSKSYDKEIREYFEIQAGQTSEWYKTDIETKPGFDIRTFRSDIHFRSSIDIQLELPSRMTVAFAMEANDTGKCYAFIEVDQSNQWSIRYNDQPTNDSTKPSYTAWTRAH